MRRTRARSTRTATVVAVLAVTATTVLAGAAPAQAASARWVAYDGKSINMRPVPAGTVSVTAYSPGGADGAEFLVDGRVVGEDDTVEQVGGRYEATADVDLSGLSGTTRLFVRYTTDGERGDQFHKWFRAVPDGAAGTAPSARWIAYEGKSINKRPVPARTVSLTAYSPGGADSAEFSLDGRVVGRDDRVEKVGNRYEAVADVDLSGVSGTTRLVVRYTTGGKPSGEFYKWFEGPEPVSKRPSTVEDRSVAKDGVVRGPGAQNTGVPKGTALTPHEGRLDLRTDGQVVDGLDVAGCVRVFAKDVTIRNTRIRCASSFAGSLAVQTKGGQGLVLEDVEIDGSGTTDVCVGWTGYTLRRANVHGCADGARFGHRVTVEKSWIHDLARVRTLHPDTLQTTSASDVVIRGNTLDAYNARTRDYANSALMIGSETGTRAVKRVLVEGNYLNGGNYTVNVRGDVNAEGVVLRDNVFGPIHRYGPFISPDRVPLGQGNVRADGAAVSTQRAS